MAETRNGYPYPTLTDPFNVPADIRNLAEATDTGISTVSARVDEMGEISGLTTVTMPAGYRARSSVSYRKIGSLVILSGYIAGDSDLPADRYQGFWTLPSDIWPDVSVSVTVPALTSGYVQNTFANLTIGSNGLVDLHLPATTRYVYINGVILVRARAE